MSFLIKDDEVWEKYENIWDVIKNKLEIKLSEPIYGQKYLKNKVREFDGVIKSNFLGNDTPKENMHYTCIACITIDSVMRMDKKTSASLFRKMQIQNKENTDVQIHKNRDQIQIKSQSQSQKQGQNLEPN